MIRLECRHDVLHALGNARDRRDGERVSFLTNSPHIARKVEGTNCRENLDSEICEGLRQQIGDADHASSTMHTASGTQVCVSHTFLLAAVHVVHTLALGRNTCVSHTCLSPQHVCFHTHLLFTATYVFHTLALGRSTCGSHTCLGPQHMWFTHLP